MPKEDWNEPGTKQGVYMIGPDAEYLEGAHAVSGDAAKLKERLRRALTRWETLRKEKTYANEPVPAVENVTVPWTTGKPLVFRVFLRDLPRGADDASGRRFTKSDLRGIWPDFVKWAWNVNWLGLDDPQALVPKGRKPEPVDAEVVGRICREALVDNVRGQNPHWGRGDVKSAELTMRRLADREGNWVIAYSGKASMARDGATYAPTLYGEGVWDPKAKQFVTLEIVSTGMRAGAGRFNQRERDKGPAPMGVLLQLFRPADPARPADEAR